MRDFADGVVEFVVHGGQVFLRDNRGDGFYGFERGVSMSSSLDCLGRNVASGI